MAGNSNFDTLLSTTLNNYSSKLEDNVFTARVLAFWLKSKSRMGFKNGGVKIVTPLIYGTNSTVKSYSRYEVLDNTPQEGITAAEFDWKQVAASVIIDGLTEAQNNDDEEIIDLLEAKMMQAEESILEVFDEMWLGDGTGNSSKDFLGLEALVGDQTSTVTSVGNIDCAVSGNEFWRSVVDRTAKVLELGDLSTNYNNASRGNDKPDLALTSQVLYEHYESLLQPAQRFSDPKTGEAGFQNLMFKGSVVTYDDNVEDDDWFNVNSKYLKLVGHKKNWFRHTPFQTPPDQDARVSQILTYGNLTISNRARQGKLEAKTAA